MRILEKGGKAALLFEDASNGKAALGFYKFTLSDQTTNFRRS
jgi:hypothetical protein